MSLFYKKNKPLKFEDNAFFLKIYLGKTGSGKTLSAVQNEVLPALRSGRVVYSNIWINYTGSNLKYFHVWEDLHEVKNALIFVDEVATILDPYKYAEYTDADKQVIAYHRKRFNDLVFTSQDISQVAKQIRINVHFWVLCQRTISFLTQWFYKFFLKTKVIVIQTLELNFHDLKALALGLGSFDLNSKIENIDDSSENDFSETLADNDSFGKTIVLPKVKTYYYTNKHFLAKDLDNKKEFLFAGFCVYCGDFKTMKPLSDISFSYPICDIHKEPLEERLAPIYSTTQELKKPDYEVVVKRYRKKNKIILVPE